MKLTNQFSCLLLICLATTYTTQSQGVTLPLSDDFQDGSTQSWTGSDTANLSDVGPTGVGDLSLEVTSVKRFVTYNQTQWSGDWNAASISQISLDVRHANPYDLVLWLGVSQGSPGFGGSGDTYVTNQSITVPGDDNWHLILFNVTSADFDPAPANSTAVPDAAAALSAVSQLRIIHNTSQEFIGEFASGVALFDNIQVVPEPASLALAGLCGLSMLLGSSRKQRVS